MNSGIEIISPASYIGNSNWLFEESQDTIWTPDENKKFENALAVYDPETPDRWRKVAALIPGKTVGDVIKQYRELEEDVSDIEAGVIQVPGYSSDSFSLEWINNQGLDDDKQFYGQGGKRSPATRSDQEKKKGVPWTEEEHRQFLLGLKKYGKGDWRNISRNFVTSRNPTQVASHAQKFFQRQLTGGKDKKRSSIHDITMADLADGKSPLDNNKYPSPSNKVMQLRQHPNVAGKEKALFETQNQGSIMVFNSTSAIPFMPPPCGISSYGVELQEQILHRGTHSEYEFGPFNTAFQMQSTQHH